MSLRDHLPGAGKRKDVPEPRQFYRSAHCELRGCSCNGRGKPDVAIQDANKNPIGYVCQRGYYDHLRERQLDQWHTWKETGTVITPHQHTMAERRGMHELAELVSDFDRYAESMAQQQHGDDHDGQE